MRLKVLFVLLLPVAASVPADDRVAPAPSVSECFLLREVGAGERRRDPAEICTQRFTPASTFKIPHALAALDAGVAADRDHLLHWDGEGSWPESSKRDHTLASAMRSSVVWYFQDMASALGAEREQHYLDAFDYGNRDPSGGLRTFWLGSSLKISPEEQVAFLVKLFARDLPVGANAIDETLAMLVQPRDAVVNSIGEHAFAAPWPKDAVVRAKTGSSRSGDGRGVRWLVGHVQRNGRAFVFASCVVGPEDLDAMAAIRLAERGLREEGVL